MGARALDGTTTSRYVSDGYFPAIALIGEVQDGNAFVGFCGGDDLVELQIDPYTRIIKQVTVLISRHYSVIDERMAIPPARDGILQANMPPQNECPALCATAYRDGLSIRISESTPTSHVRCGDVVFGITSTGELSEILLTAMTREEADHARSVLMGEGFEELWEPVWG